MLAYQRAEAMTAGVGRRRRQGGCWVRVVGPVRQPAFGHAQRTVQSAGFGGGVRPVAQLVYAVPRKPGGNGHGARGSGIVRAALRFGGRGHVVLQQQAFHIAYGQAQRQQVQCQQA